MSRLENSWPIVPPCCRNPISLRHRCLLAFTVPRDALSSRASSFDHIESESTRILFHLFLELCARVSVKVGGVTSLAMEQVLDASGTCTRGYTFFFVVRDWLGGTEDPCEEELRSIIEAAHQRHERLRSKRSQPWEKWHELISRSRIKTHLQRHIGFAAPSSNFESGEEWGSERLDAHLIFSLAHAFALRGKNVCREQNLCSCKKYLKGENLKFPRPRYVYIVHDHEVREPRLLHSRRLPDWQARSTPSSAIQYVDALLVNSDDRADCRDLLESSFAFDDTETSMRDAMASAYASTSGISVNMEEAHSADLGSTAYAVRYTYEKQRDRALERLTRIEAVAQNRSQWKDLPDPVNAARRLYLLHQRMGFETHVSHMRGAFPENVSPQTRTLMGYAEEHIFDGSPLPEHVRDYDELDRFCNREIWRHEQYSESFLLATHNIPIMMLVLYASLDAYRYELIKRVGLNILLHTEEGGFGKSQMIATMLRKARINLDILTYKTSKSQAVSTKFGEQCYRTNVIEELPASMITEKGSIASGEAARIFKTVLTNPFFQAESLRFDPETGDRIPCKDISLWIGIFLAAANIEGLLSWVMPPPMIDRFMVISLDQSPQAIRLIQEKQRESDTKEHDPAFMSKTREISTLFRKEEFVYAEHCMLERVMAVRPTSRDGAAIMCDWLSHHLEGLGYPPCVRNRDKICGLATNIALLDAVDTVCFDRGGIAAGKPYDIGVHAHIERRNWVRCAHMVRAVGIAPHLFLDVDERDVRLALCEEFEQQPRRKQRFPPDSRGSHQREQYSDEDDCSDRDTAYAAIPLGRSGLKELASRLQTRLRNCPERRILPTRDAIRYRLQEWIRRNAPLDDWTADAKDKWPTRTPGGDRPLQPIAKIIELYGGSRVYAVQIGWIHRDMLPDPAKQILQMALRGFFGHRNQGGFSAPYGSDSITGDTRIIHFKSVGADRPKLTVPGLRGAPSDCFNCNLDDWALDLHNKRLYIEQSPSSRLGDHESIVESEDASTLYFSGRPLSDMLPPKKIDEQKALRALTIKPRHDEDADALDSEYVIADDDGRPSYHWDLWTRDGDRGLYSQADPLDSPEVANEKRLRNRGEYKLVEPHPRVEQARIVERLRMLGDSDPPKKWSERSRLPIEAQKRKWGQIARGKTSLRFREGVSVPM